MKIAMVLFWIGIVFSIISLIVGVVAVSGREYGDQ